MAEKNIGYPIVYVVSQIPDIAKCLKSFLPSETEIRSLKLPAMFDRNLLLTDEQVEYIKEAEVVLSDGLLLLRYYSKMPNLKWAQCSWAGVDPLVADVEAGKSIPSFQLTRHAGSSFASVIAEYVVCQILNFERNMMNCWSAQQSKTWERVERFTAFRSLDDFTVAILGVGNMGCGIAKFLKSRGTKVLGFSRTVRAPGAKEYECFDSIFTDLADILPFCDYFCNTLPQTKDTRGLLTPTVLKLCTKKPVFINVGRGSVIKEEVLVQALRDGLLSGAILDVFEKEPLSSSSELWDIPKVLITPHIGAISKAEHVAEEFARNYNRFVEGKELHYVVNWSSGY